jgi:hypothetical protein
MADNYRVNCFLLCDDIRTENNGKELLIGVYNKLLLIPTIPAQLTNLCVRFEVSLLSDREINQATFELRNPEGNTVLRGSASLNKPQRNDIPLLVNVVVGPIIFVTIGQYTIWLGLDREPENVGSFLVQMQPAAPAK